MNDAPQLIKPKDNMNTYTSILNRADITCPDQALADIEVPVTSGPQRQGDILIIPRAHAGEAELSQMAPIPPTGIAVVHGEATGNTHLLMADTDIVCLWQPATATPGDVGLGVLHVPAGGVAWQFDCDPGVYRRPALAWPDGMSVHAWHGTRVPAWVVNDDATVDRIQAEPNTEIRRCAIERFGWDRYLTSLGVQPVSVEDDPGNPGHILRLFDLPDSAQLYDEPVRLLVMENASLDRDGSRRTFAETVPGDIRSAVDAAAWQFDCDPGVYRRLVRAS